jgi:hypothetical protein
VIVAASIVCFVAGVATGGLWPHAVPYEAVERLRAEQDSAGTHAEQVRQRFYRLYKEHPKSAMYIYLWSRCVEDPAEQLELAQQGIQADPQFSWNYNMLSRAFARLNRVPEAYEQARKGAALDPGNLELATKVRALKIILDRKLLEQASPAEGTGRRYVGLFRSPIHSPEAGDMQAVKKARLGDFAGPVGDAVHGFTVCANPYADSCVRAYVPRDARFGAAWPVGTVDVTALHENELVTLGGSVAATSSGEKVFLVDSVTAER